ncbi:MAG: YrhA family protein [Alphaproteobacteria bacterium]
MLNRILETLKKDNAVMFIPADDKAIRFSSSMLTSHYFSPIPPNYISLLKFSDGLIWNGVELFGTRSHEREKQGYILPGIIEVNLDFLGYDFFAGKILLGKVAEELFVYDARERKYLIIDRIDFAIGASFPTFSEALYLFVDDLF